MRQEREEQEEKTKSKIDEPLPYVVFITSKSKLNRNEMVFGTYNEVTIDTLRWIYMKYLDSFNGLTQYLLDFHLLEHKPFLVAIDGFEQFWSDSADPKSSQWTTKNKQLKADFLVNIIKNIEILYKNTSNPVKFVWAQRIFATIPDSKMGAPSSVENSLKEYNFLTNLYTQRAEEVYLILIRPNAGGDVIKVNDESEEEEQDAIPIEVKSKNETEAWQFISEFIVKSTPFQNDLNSEDEFEFIKSKMLSLYKLKFDSEAIFKGKEPKALLFKLDWQEDVEESKSNQPTPKIELDPEDEVLTRSMVQLRDHILGDAKIDYENQQDGEQIVQYNVQDDGPQQSDNEEKPKENDDMNVDKNSQDEETKAQEAKSKSNKHDRSEEVPSNTDDDAEKHVKAAKNKNRSQKHQGSAVEVDE